MKYQVLIFALLLGWSGCVTDLEVPLPEHDPLLVVECVLRPGQAPFLFLTRSYAINEVVTPADILVGDATVEIWSEGQRLSTLPYRDTLLRFDPIEPADPERDISGHYHDPSLIVEAGKTYELRVSHPDYPDLRAVSQVPSIPEIVDVQLFRDSIVERSRLGSIGGQVARTRVRSILRVKVQDPAERQNHYLFDVRLFYADLSFQSENDTISGLLFPLHNLAYDQEGNLTGNREAVSDADFNGELGTIDLLVNLPDCCFSENEPRTEIVLHALELGVRTYEGALHAYLQQVRRQNNSNNTGIESALLPSEPVTISGNIEGGLGIFSSENLASFRYEL